MTRVAYVNGRYVPFGEASVHVEDRGYQLADGVYEVMAVRDGRLRRAERHLARLDRSLGELRIARPLSHKVLRLVIAELLRRNRLTDGTVYLQITRGVAKRDHAFPKDTAPTVFLMTNALSVPTPEAVDSGVAAVTLLDNRWLRCDLKTVALLPNVLLRQQALDAGAVEAVLLRDGFLTEGAASNIFAVKDGVLLIPPKSHLILPGITYDVILELAHKHGIRCEIREVSEAEVRSAQELWLSSSTREVLAITRLDGKAVGDGRPGPLFQRMYALFQEFKAEVRRAPEPKAHA